MSNPSRARRGDYVEVLMPMPSSAGARLLVNAADATGLTVVFGNALGGLRQRQGCHDPGRVAVDLA